MAHCARAHVSVSLRPQLLSNCSQALRVSLRYILVALQACTGTLSSLVVRYQGYDMLYYDNDPQGVV